MFSALYTAHFTLHSAHCTVHTAQCTLHSTHCTVHTDNLKVYTINCTLVLHCEGSYYRGSRTGALLQVEGSEYTVYTYPILYMLQSRLYTLQCYPIIEDTARYAGLLLAPAEGFGLRLRFFYALRAKKEVIKLFCPIFGVQ